MGIRKFDKVKCQDQELFVKGRMSTGYAVLMDIEGKPVDLKPIAKLKTVTRYLNLKAGFFIFSTSTFGKSKYFEWTAILFSQLVKPLRRFLRNTLKTEEQKEPFIRRTKDPAVFWLPFR